MTKTAYRVYNSASAVVLGIFLAETEDAALDALAVRLGYKSNAEIPAEIGGAEDIEVEDVDREIDLAVDRITAGMVDNQESNGGFYCEWLDAASARDVYCNFGAGEPDEGSDEARIVEITSDSDAAEIIDSRVQAWLDNAIEDQRAEVKAGITDADNIYLLRDALERADELAKAEGHSSGSDILYDATHLRLFGGEEINDTNNVYSWSEDEKLIVSSAGWEVVDR